VDYFLRQFWCDHFCPASVRALDIAWLGRMSVWQLGVVAFFLRERLRAYRLGKAIAITSDAVFNFAELLRGFRPQQKSAQI
jgi:hypothetical protein